MATVVELSDGIEERLSTISGLRGSSEWQDTINPPAAMPLLSDVRALTFDAVWRATFRILVVSGGLSQMGIGKASRALKAYMAPSGTESIIAALEGDLTLGGVAETVILDATNWGEEREYQINGVAYWGAPLEGLQILFTDS
jgi:hypothetical protein